MEQGIELVETPAFGPIIKNSADIRIALDGLEIGMTQHHINEFCLVSGDSDFLPLIKRLQYLGKTVVVISGTKFTADLVRKNCNEFISYENLLAESVGATEDATTLEGAFVLLSRTINTLHERGMEVRSSTVKQMMLQLNPVFSERNFGCSQFKQFLDKGCRAGIIKLGRRDPNSGEYTVLLPSVFEEESVETPVPEATVAKRPTRRIQRADEDLGLHDLEAPAPEETSTPEPSGNGDTSVASRTLRRGRLRFSGKTWQGASRSVLQPQPDAPTEEQAAPTQAESTPVAEPQGDEIPEEVAAPVEVASEEPTAARKRGTRGGRRRKPATQTTEVAEAAPSASEAVEVPAPVEAPVPTEVDAAPAESPEAEAEKKPKTAAKKTVRRRAPAKKKAE
jgi:hypothetical protein